MIPRNLAAQATAAAQTFPVVTITGPRQSGKTTLCRALFSAHPYVSLEALDTREFATQDPRGFLARYREGAVLDEVQRVPSLLSYLQGVVDEDPRPGRFVLTGSQHLGLSESVAQSLAGRTAILHLLPLSCDELQSFEDPPGSLWETVWSGGYPAIYDRGVPADSWLDAYIATYVERDVRQVRSVGDLAAFTTFMRLTAARTGTVRNSSSLGSDAGVDDKTARAWLSVLETSWLTISLRAWHRNVGKRLVKSPKLHLLDTGLACRLLGIQSADQLAVHPLRGAIFESWVVSEVFKRWTQSRSATPPLYHLRTSGQLEADLIIEDSTAVRVVDVKSGATPAGSWFKTLERARGVVLSAERLGRAVTGAIVFGGAERQDRTGGTLLPWRGVAELVDDA